jgi:hypothetical protein
MGLGGAVYVTKLDAQITAALIAQTGMIRRIERISTDFVPGKYLRSWRADLQLEDRRQQVQIDRLEAEASGRPYNGKGYDGTTR